MILTTEKLLTSIMVPVNDKNKKIVYLIISLIASMNEGDEIETPNFTLKSISDNLLYIDRKCDLKEALEVVQEKKVIRVIL